MRPFRLVRLTPCWLLICALLSATGCEKTTPLPSRADSVPMQSVSVRMKWFFAGTMTGWFAGKEQAIFSKNGIDITINPGGPDNNSVKLVASGTDLFGVAGADEVLLAREKGIPVVAIAVLFKDTPICFIAKQDRGVSSPADWSGKKVEVSYGSNAEFQYRALVKKFNVKNVTEVPYTFNLAPLIEDKVDVSVAYKMDQVVTLQQKGINLSIISPKEYGINPYGDVVITTEETIKNNAELVKRFVSATTESFRWAASNEERAVDALIKGVPDLKALNESLVWKATIPFLTGSDGVESIGVMKAERWDQTLELLREFELVKGELDIKQAYHSFGK